jgi:hypothetical protein
MIDDTLSSARDDITRASMPILAAPVDRSPGTAARAGGTGVEPSDWFTDLVGGVAPAIPGILGALGI